MNRAERRRLEKQGKKIARDPVFTVSASSAQEAIWNSPVARELLDKEVAKRFLELDREYTLDMDTMVLWTLRNQGWGLKRLRRFYRQMFYWHRKLREHYEIPECFPERQILKEQGIDVEAWFKEMFNDDGTYKETLEDMANDLY